MWWWSAHTYSLFVSQRPLGSRFGDQYLARASYGPTLHSGFSMRAFSAQSYHGQCHRSNLIHFRPPLLPQHCYPCLNIITCKCILIDQRFAFKTSLQYSVLTWSGRGKPTEAFSFECEVTAHQTATVSTIAVVVVAADFFTYKSSSLLFHTGDVENPILTGSAWSKFELGCAPEISWLSINSNTGTLTYTGSSSSHGALVLNLSSFISINGFMMLADVCPRTGVLKGWYAKQWNLHHVQVVCLW